MKEAYQGRASGRVREFALYGDTTGETATYTNPLGSPFQPIQDVQALACSQ